MSSERIKRRTNSKYVCWGELKNNKEVGIKGCSFYSSSRRKALKHQLLKELDSIFIN